MAERTLTLSGARRRLEEEGEPDPLLEVAAAELESGGGAVGKDARSFVTDETRAHLQEARTGLQWILKTLDSNGAGEFVLAAVPQPASGAGKTRKKK